VIEYHVADEVERYLSEKAYNSYNNDSTFSFIQTAPAKFAIPIDLRQVKENTPEDVTSMGLAIFQHRGSNLFNIANVTALDCVVDARWAKGKTVVESGLKYPDSDRILNYDFRTQTSRNITKAEMDQDKLDIMGDGFVPQTPELWSFVQIDLDWFDMVSPVVPNSVLERRSFGHTSQADSRDAYENTTQSSALDRLLVFAGHVPDAEYFNHDQDVAGINVSGMEVILAEFLADAISRTGAHRNIEICHFFAKQWPCSEDSDWNATTARAFAYLGPPRDTFPLPEEFRDRDPQKMALRVEFTGYIMTFQSWFDRLCMAVLLLHAVVALVYTAGRFVHGDVGEGWDTTPELIALSNRSPASSLLANTSAGIRYLKTVGAIAMVKGCAPTQGTAGEERLQLLFKRS
jgi:hypothetical protein